MTSGFWAMSVDKAARCAAASAPAATDLSSTSLKLAACALALLVIAAIQPWSAAGAENPITTFLPAAELGLFVSAPLVCAAVGVSLLVQAASNAAAPMAAVLPSKSLRRDRSRTS